MGVENKIAARSNRPISQRVSTLLRKFQNTILCYTDC